MRKLLYLICCMVCIQFASAENNGNERTETTEATAVAAEYVSITVPRPTAYDEGSITLTSMNVSGPSYTLDNKKDFYGSKTYTIQKGNYRVTALSVGRCNNMYLGVAKIFTDYTATLQVNGVYTIQNSGSIQFTCP